MAENAKSGAKSAKAREGEPSGGASLQDGSIAANVPPTRATGIESATGQALRTASGEEVIPEGKERGSQLPIEGGDPKPTLEGGDKPRGMQAEDAIFVSNGEVPRNNVATPTGLAPVSTVAGTQEEANALIDKRVEEQKAFIKGRINAREALDEATVSRLGRGELRAIGLQRGYEMPESGTRSTRAAFLNAQEKDEAIDRTPAPKAGKKTSNKAMEKETKRTAPKGAKKGSKRAR